MTALTDTEILAALPVESRKKIDSAFEALSQSLPSDKEKIILYRVAHTLKLNPTDTHFSVMAALHYYLQLYQVIPDKIAKAGDEQLKGHINNLKKAAENEMAKARDAVICELSKKVGEIAQQLAGDAATAERNRSFYFAGAAIFSCALIFGGTGYAVRMAADALSINTLKNAVTEANTQADAAVAAAEKKQVTKLSKSEKMAAGLAQKRVARPKHFLIAGGGWLLRNAIRPHGKSAICKMENIACQSGTKYSAAMIKSMDGKYPKPDKVSSLPWNQCPVRSEIRRQSRNQKICIPTKKETTS
ncbi:MAG: hypothetical protein COZ20_01700 [Gallionellales bacterium CG_4_10_14_3_um_filter_54_96]|nr:MAG: hypothetical protein COZ77_09050 [Gallionellales bacterium CG_4_8_14_3_um_filter_54_18]PIY06340.1 MAG: hypothetical protein COZ20_01700 [Gallionellales bacterium CG_4_10_14_3_um_filter_54_96]